MSDRIVVTGGLGFIGAALVRHLVARGQDLVNIDAHTYAGDERRLAMVGDRVTTVTADVASEDCRQVIAGERPRAVVHLAAETHVTRSETDADRFFVTNVEGTKNVIEAAIDAGVDRFLHVSTDEVYGPALDRPFVEDDKEPGEGRATSAYARSKALADDLALGYADRIALIVVRPTNCFGPFQHPEKAVPRWTVRALQGQPLPVWGDGGYVRDWMHVDDACAGIEIALQKGVPGSAYNIGPQDEIRTNLEIARTIARLAGQDESVVYLSEYDRPDHDRRYSVDATRLRSLGWSPSLSFEDRLAETVEWYRSSEAWWRPLVADAEDIYDDARVRNTL